MKPDVFQEIKNVAQTLVEEIRDEYIKEVSLIFSYLEKHIPKIKLNQLGWENIQNETITSIDGGLAPFYLASKYPFMVRGLAYTKDLTKKVGEKRCFFEPYVIKTGFVSLSDRPEDRVSTLRILAELETAIRTLKSDQYLSTFIQLHGPLIYHMSVYVGIDVKEKDVSDVIGDVDLKEFLKGCESCYFPCKERVCKNTFRINKVPIFCVILKRFKILSDLCKEKNVKLVGVVERGASKEYTIILISQMIQDLLKKEDIKMDSIFKKCLGKSIKNIKSELSVISSQETAKKEIEKYAKIIAKHYGLRDEIVLGELLDYGEMISPYISEMKKIGVQKTYAGREKLIPDIFCSYIRVSEKGLPFRVEFPPWFKEDDIMRTSSRVFLFSSLLPHYAFPVNLDVVDKMAKIPRWLKELFMSRVRSGLVSYLLKDKVSDVEKRIGRFYLSPYREFERRPGIF